MTYSITFTFPISIPEEWDYKAYVQNVLEAIDDATSGEATIVECKEVKP